MFELNQGARLYTCGQLVLLCSLRFCYLGVDV